MRKNSTSQSDARTDADDVCFKGRFIRDACNGSEIVEVLEPKIDSLQESIVLGNSGELLAKSVFTTQIPDSLKNGEPFYFYVNGPFVTYFHDNVCSWPKYAAGITSPSRSACEPAGTQF